MVTKQGGRKWVFMYTRAEKRNEMGLGSATKGAVSLARAREAAAHARAVLSVGRDPLAAKRARSLSRHLGSSRTTYLRHSPPNGATRSIGINGA